jgi:hypothetical protein
VLPEPVITAGQITRHFRLSPKFGGLGAIPREPFIHRTALN